jgi:hypothetical protein
VASADAPPLVHSIEGWFRRALIGTSGQVRGAFSSSPQGANGLALPAPHVRMRRNPHDIRAVGGGRSLARVVGDWPIADGYPTACLLDHPPVAT